MESILLWTSAEGEDAAGAAQAPTEDKKRGVLPEAGLHPWPDPTNRRQT